MLKFENGLNEVLRHLRSSKDGVIEFIPNEKQLKAIATIIKNENEKCYPALEQYTNSDNGLKSNNTLFIYFDKNNKLAIEW